VARQQKRHKIFAAKRRIFCSSVKNQAARTFTDSYFFGNFTEKLGDDFDESQQALSQRVRRPLTWEAVQFWGRFRWTFSPILNAGTTRDIAYGSKQSSP